MNSSRIQRVLLPLLLFAASSHAQYGTARANYYPNSYEGTTFTGTVMHTTGDTISLAFVHGSKTEAFEGYVEAPCNFPISKTSNSPLPLTRLPNGTVVTAFFQGRTVKENGSKKHENQVVALAFVEVNGRKIPEIERRGFYCLKLPLSLTFKAFSGRPEGH